MADPTTDSSTITLVSRTGRVVDVPASDLPEYDRLGYTPASADAIRQREREATYGTVPQQLATGVEGALGTATFGATDWLERGLGISTPEAMAARQETNPIAHGVGSAVGVLAPALLTAGATAEAQGAAAAAEGAEAAGGALAAARSAARIMPSNVVSRGADAIKGALLGEGEAAGLLPDASGLVGRAVRSLAASGAGSAVEGAAYGAGNAVHEAALGDPNLTGESALSEVGLGALVGLGAGVGGGILSGIAHKITPSAVAEKLAEWTGQDESERGIRGFLQDVEARSAIKAAGGIQSDITRIRKQIGREGLASLAREGQDLGLVGAFSTPTSTLEKSQALMKEAGGEMGAMLDRADAATVPGKAPKIGDVVDRARKEILAPLAENPLQQEAAARMSAVIKGYGDRFAGGVTLNDLHAARRQVSDALFGLRGNMDPFANSFKDALHDFRGILSDEISAGMDRAGLSSDAWKAANRKYQVAAKFDEFAQKGLDRENGNNLIPLTSILGAVGGGSVAGPLGALVSGAASYAAKKYSAGLIGAGARALRRGLGDAAPVLADAADATATADALAARKIGAAADTFTPGSRETRIITPQVPAGEPARYEVVEAESLIPSHKPESFAPNPAYPADVQERVYHSAGPEQKKVQLGGQRLDSSLLLADAPTATDGPPIVTSGARHVVLGGNGRTMMIQRAFKNPEAVAAYRKTLEDKAAVFGIKPAEFAGMKAPVLVRVASDLPDTAKASDLSAAVRRYNENLTQALSPVARGVADARTVSPATLAQIGDLLAGSGDASLRDVMRDKPRELVAILRRDGIINDANAGAFMTGDTLTEEGRLRIEGLFLGRVLGSADRVAATSPAVLGRVERITPSLVRVDAINPDLSEIETLRAAVDLLNDARHRGISLGDSFAQRSLFDAGAAHDPGAKTLALMLDGMKSNDLTARLKAWAQHAAVDPRQATMFEAGPTEASARAILFEGAPGAQAAPIRRVAVAEDAQPASAPPAAPPDAIPAPASDTKVAALAALERNNQRVQSKIDAAASTLVRSGVKAARIARSEVIAGVPKSFGEPHAAALKRFEHAQRTLTPLAQNPEQLHARLVALTDDTHDHAPETSGAVQTAATRATLFLASKLPTGPAPKPLSAPWHPNRAQLATFDHYWHAVDDPTSVLRQAAAGVLTPEALEAVSTVYPALMDAIKQGVVTSLATHPRPTYQARLRIGRLLGVDLDGSLSLRAPPATGAQQQPAQAPAPRASSAKHLTLGDRSQTATDKAEARD